MIKISGSVESFQAITKTMVTINLNMGTERQIVRLTVGEPWVVSNGDHIDVIGEYDKKSGVFSAYGYDNLSKRVRFFPEYSSGVKVIAFFWYLITGFFILGTGFLLSVNLFDSRGPDYLMCLIVVIPFSISCFAFWLGYKRFNKIKNIFKECRAMEI
ncbi:hypothetical protein [Vibrio porteresiae]|uniref:Uncharacterized protein n=1 Tax=Vibrio porteresiae DSM 19223 TaxID=1123496 RepID=A0ABZ0QKB8_9VIBR|nr:hypothetical protein [Vibrio porteresiae]WPC75905.1 hypothetical protein R8Z52_23615 [Vibrio porteresiae DSM 19223]